MYKSEILRNVETHIRARRCVMAEGRIGANFYVIIRRLCLHTYVFARREKEIPQADDFRAVDLERSGGLSQCQQVQGHAKSCQQQEYEERPAIWQDERLQGTWSVR